MSFLFRILLAFVSLPAWGQGAPIVVGAAIPESGVLAPLAADYRKGLLVWLEEVNAAGGLLGRRVELRLLDDGSDARRSGELYAELIRGKADLLIGPYGSAATLMAAAQTERAQRVLINGAGPSLEVHKRSPRYLFQSTFSNSAYGTGPLELARSAGLKAVAVLARSDLAVREMAEATHEQAQKLGFRVDEVQSYPGGSKDFAPQVARARDAVDGWLAFGELRDTAEMLRTFRNLGDAPRLF